MARAEGLEPEILWLLVKLARASSHRPLPLTGEGGEPLKFNTPDVLQEELMHIDQQLAGRILSTDDQPISPGHQEKFMISALREEAIASSMLEGAETTRRDAKEMLASGRKPRTRGEMMVANNFEAMNFIRDHRNDPVTIESLLRIQSILTAGTLDRPDECGRFRTAVDDVSVTDKYGETLHTPPPASELPERLRALCAFANGKTGERFIHPVIRASVVHFQMGFDHPFCDGNGRTARTLFYWAMLKAGYWLFEYLPISRLIYAGPSKYARAYLYTETDEFDVTYFLAYKAKIIGRARKELGEYIARKQKEMSAARKVFESDFRLNHRQRATILRVLRSPNMTVTIQEHQDKHAIAYGTARTDLLDLEKWGYLLKIQVGNRFEFVSGPKMAAETVADPEP
jgi:Fic family protein